MRKKTVLTVIAILAVAVIAVLCLSACEEEYNIDHLEIYASPRTSYFVGEELDYEGASIKVVYTNGTDRIVPVDETMISSFNSSVLGPQYIKIYYGNRSVSVKVEVNRYATESSALEIPSANYDLIQGQPLNLKDSYLVITFADGSVQRVPLTQSMCTGYDAGRVGQQEISVRYTFDDGEVINALFNVTVSERRISSVSVRTLPTRNVYYLGDEDVSLAGGEIFVTYNNGYTETLPMMTGNTMLEGLEIVSFDSSAANVAAPVGLSYYNFAISYTVTISTRDIASYSFDAEDVPEQLEGTALNLGDMMFAITYTNDETITLRANDENFGDYVEIVGYDPGLIGEQGLIINFKYGDVTLATPGLITVTVRARTLTSVRVPSSDASESNPNPVIYLGNVYELGSFKLELLYDNGDVETRSLASSEVEVYDFTASGAAEGTGEVVGSFVYNDAGERLWKVTYTVSDAVTQESAEYECEYNFEVVLPTVVSWEFIGYDADEPLIYFEFIDGAPEFSRFADGLSINLVYDSGLELTRNLSELSGEETGFGFEVSATGTTGNTTATFVYYDVYDGVRKDLTIENVSAYIARSISRIAVTKSAEFDSLLAPEEPFEDAGLIVEVSYADSDEPVIFELTEGADAGFYAAFSFEAEGSVQLSGGGIMFPEEDVYTVSVNSGDITSHTEIVYPDAGGISVTVVALPESLTGVFADAEGMVTVDTGSTSTDIVMSVGTKIPGSYYLGVRYTGTENGAARIKYVPFSDAKVTVEDVSGMGIGIYEVSVAYSDKDVNLSLDIYISIVARTPVSISAQFPRTVFYYYPNGSYESLSDDLEDIKVTVEYDNGTFEIIEYNPDSGDSRINFNNIAWNIEDVSNIQPMSQEVTVTYASPDGVTLGTVVTIYLEEPLPTSISWANGTVMYAVIGGGKAFALNELYLSDSNYVQETPPKAILTESIILHYSSGNISDEVELSLQDIDSEVGYDPSSFNKNSLAAQGVRLNYKGCVFTVNVKVLVSTDLQSIALNLDRITVIQGGDVDVSDMVLTLRFSDGEYQVPMRREYFVDIDDILSDNTVPGTDYSFTVQYTYNDVTRRTSVPVTVLQRQLIAIQFKNVKTEFVEGEAFTPGDGSYILALYDNGRQDIVYFTDDVPYYDGTNSVTESNFYIDIRQFDNSEIASGEKTKQQQITVVYTDTVSNVTKSDSYIIYMRDRRYPTVTFDPANDYDRIYKDADSSEQIAANVTGYSSYNTEGPPFKLWDGEGDIADIADREFRLYYVGADGTRYESSKGEIPTNAGTYDIFVEYKGDALHNPITVESPLPLVIEKRELNITFTDSSYAPAESLRKVYGEESDSIYVKIEGLADGDSYESIFGTLIGDYMLVYPENYEGGLAIFDIVYSYGGSVIEMTDRTAAGNYMLGLNAGASAASTNYEIVCDPVQYVVARRPVRVTAPSVELVYGSSVPVLSYIVEPDPGDEARGLLSGDNLSGSLSRESGYDAGVYIISIGTLSNSNYDIDFYKNDPENAPTVTIQKRSVYIRLNSDTATYGSDYTVSEPQAEYFSDAALQNTENIFASRDTANGETAEDILGQLTISYEFNGETIAAPWKNGVGDYSIKGTFVNVPEAAKNYSVKFTTSGTLTVMKRSVSVTVEGMVAEYGDLSVSDVNSLEISYIAAGVSGNTGLLPDDELGLKFRVNIGDVDSLVVGNYVITVSSWDNPDYQVSVEVANLSIIEKDLTVSVPEQYLTKVYDGRLPSVSADCVELFDEGETYSDETLLREARDGLNIAFIGVSDNVGSYALSVSSKDSNFTFELSGALNYVITSLSINITADDYYYTAGDVTMPLKDAELIYSGTTYRLSARIPEDEDGDGDGLQKQYDSNGNAVTDNDNNYIYDTVTVTVSISSATNAAAYTVTATAFNNANYTLVSAESLSFEIKKKEILVYLDLSEATGDDPYTVIREYSGEIQQFIQGELADDGTVILGDFALSDTGVSNVQLGFMLNGNDVDELLDVVYSSIDNQPFVYDIVVKEASNPGNNYELKMAEDYKFILRPRTIQLSIFDTALSKNYDGQSPPASLGESQFDVVFSSSDPNAGNLAGFVKSMVKFTYTRNDKDFRQNSSVGTYSVGVTTQNTNYAVSLIQPYQYSINGVDYGYYLADAYPEKQYDGAGIEFNRNDLILPIPPTQSQPSIRTFAYDEIMKDNENIFVELMTDAESDLADLLRDYSEVNLSTGISLGAIADNARKVLTDLSELSNRFNVTFNPGAGFLSYGEQLLEILGLLTGYVTDIATYADAGNQGETATSINVANEAITQLVSIFDKENSYIIFVLGELGISEIRNTGTYRLVTFANDYNRNLTDRQKYYEVEITAKRLEIHIGTDENYSGFVTTEDGNVYVSYGDVDADASTTPFIPYRIYDPENGVYLLRSIDYNEYNYKEKDLSYYFYYPGQEDSSYSSAWIYIYGNLEKSTGYGMNSYQILRGSVNVYADSNRSEKSLNYQLVNGSAGEFGSYIVSKREITLKFGSPISTGIKYGQRLVKDSIAEFAAETYTRTRWSDFLVLTGTDLPYGEKISDFNFSDISYTCLINGVNVLNAQTTAAGQFVLKAILPASAAPNYVITIEDGSFIVDKAVLTMGYTVSGANEIVKTYGDLLDHNWLISNIRYLGFIGNDNANNVIGHLVDSDGKPIPNVTDRVLASIEWTREWKDKNTDEPLTTTDPGAANCPVGEYVLSLKNSFTSDKILCTYTFDNYVLEMPENGYNVKVNARGLVLSAKSYSDGSAVGTYYTGQLLEGIVFAYSGFITGENENSLGLPAAAYDRDYCSNLNVGTATLGEDFVTNFDEIKSKLANYSLTFSGRASVSPIPIEVYIAKNNGLSALYWYDAENLKKMNTFGPYTVGYQYTVVEDNSFKYAKLVEGSMGIESGVYGVEDFCFSVPAEYVGELEKFGIYAEDIDVANLVSGIEKYAANDFRIDVSTSPEGDVLSGSEPLNYTDLYKHSLEVVKDTFIKDGEYYTTYRLQGMNFGTSNYTFSYKTFDVRMVIAVDAVIATISEYVDLLESDISKYIDVNGKVSDEMRKIINFSAFSIYSMLEGGNLVVYEDPAYENTALAKNIIIDIAGADLTQKDITYLLKLYYYISGKVDDALVGSITHNTNTFYYSGADVNKFVVSDERTLEYSSESSYSILPVRFFGTKTEPHDMPEFKQNGDGSRLDYDVSISTETNKVYYTAETAYDIGHFEFRALLPDGINNAEIRIMVNGITFADENALYIKFDAGCYNKFYLVYATATDTQVIEYPLNYGYIFDGRMHSVEFELQKSKNPLTGNYFTFVAKIDGKSGALVNLAEAFPAISEKVEVGTAGSLFNESNGRAGLSVCAADFVLENVELTKKGRYDNFGIISTIKGDSDTVIVASLPTAAATDYADFSSATLHELFGLKFADDGAGNIIAPAGYSYEFYIDGVTFDAGKNVSLAGGKHKLEVAIYKNGVLADADELIIQVVSMMSEGSIGIIEYNDAGEIVSEDESEAQFTGIRELDFAKYEADRVGGSLVIDSRTGNAQSIISYTAESRISYMSASFTAEPAAVRTGTSISYPAYEETDLNLCEALVRIELFEVAYNTGLKQVNFVLLYLQSNAASTLSRLSYTVVPALETVNEIYDESTGSTRTESYRYQLRYFNEADLDLSFSGSDRPIYTVEAFVDKQPSDNFGTGNMVIQFTAKTDAGYYSYMGELAPSFGEVYGIDSVAVARLGLPIEGVDNNTTVTNIVANSDIGAQMTLYDIRFGNGISVKETKYAHYSVGVGSEDEEEIFDNYYYLSDNGYSPTAYRMNGLAGSFNSDTSFRIYLPSLNSISFLTGQKGVYIEYANNILTFAYYYLVVYSGEEGSFIKEYFTGSQSVTLTSANVYEFTLNYETNLDGDRDSNTIRKAYEPLIFNGDEILRADNNNPVYYQTVTITVNGESYEFYCPLFDDGFAGWTLKCGGKDLHNILAGDPGTIDPNYANIKDVYQQNIYGGMDPNQFYRMPTLLSYIGYVCVEQLHGTDIGGINYLVPTLGVDYSRSESAITDDNNKPLV